MLANGIYALRLFFSSILFTFFGYISPVLNSIKAIVNRDVDGTKEYVTYWVVLSTFMYIEAFLSAFNYFRNYPPEMKVVYVLWLTLPRFQGAYRIYTVILKPYFEKYEIEIDRKVEELAGQVKVTASRQFKTILWQLFLAPNDGLIGGLGTMLAAIDLNSKLTFVQNLSAPANLALSDSDACDVYATEKIEQSTPIRLLTMQKQVLFEFSKMLSDDGICVFAGSSEFLSPCQLSLSSNKEKLLRISVFDAEECCNSEPGWSLSVPLHRIDSAELATHSNPRSNEGGLCSESLIPALILIKITTDEQTIVFLREEEHEGGETEALLAGLLLLIADSKAAMRVHVESEVALKNTGASQLKYRFGRNLAGDKKGRFQIGDNPLSVVSGGEAKENCANVLNL